MVLQERMEPRPARGGPRYQQIQAELRLRIGSSRYAVGTLLPTESELCAEFGASRHTVREALRRLTEQGLVARRQGAGTLVISAEPQRNYVQSFRSLSELFQFALDTDFEVLKTELVRLDRAIAEALGAEKGSAWHLITGLRRSRPGGEPICFTKSYVPARLGAIVPELPGCVGPFYAHIEARSGEPIVEADQEIKAEPMTRATAAALGAPPDAIALRLLRRYRSAEGVLIASFNWHPADRFVYRMALQRDQA